MVNQSWIWHVEATWLILLRLDASTRLWRVCSDDAHVRQCCWYTYTADVASRLSNTAEAAAVACLVDAERGSSIFTRGLLVSVSTVSTRHSASDKRGFTVRQILQRVKLRWKAEYVTKFIVCLVNEASMNMVRINYIMTIEMLGGSQPRRNNVSKWTTLLCERNNKKKVCLV